jgi:hypothetical protein
MLRKVCSFVAILLAAALLQPEAGAATKSPCATEGPFSLGAMALNEPPKLEIGQ